jgi:sugar O-acyltransferase (sialic acid O-acetyltransferase NeuD family)
MSLPRIVLVGASGHGRVALDAARCQNRYQVVGWLDTFVAAGTGIAGLNVLSKPADLDRLSAEHRIDGFFVGISDNLTRASVCESIRKLCPQLEFVTIIHPSAVVARDVEVGPGSLILAGAVVNTNSRLGTGCIVNTRASLDHDGEMRDYSCLLPGVVTGGNVVIGEFSCICLGAHLAHKVRIGEHSVVGAGAVVLADIPSYSLAYGVPARVARSRQAGERHF